MPMLKTTSAAMVLSAVATICMASAPADAGTVHPMACAPSDRVMITSRSDYFIGDGIPGHRVVARGPGTLRLSVGAGISFGTSMSDHTGVDLHALFVALNSGGENGITQSFTTQSSYSFSAPVAAGAVRYVQFGDFGKAYHWQDGYTSAQCKWVVEKQGDGKSPDENNPGPGFDQGNA
jgi:hypothetical protein